MSLQKLQLVLTGIAVTKLEVILFSHYLPSAGVCRLRIFIRLMIKDSLLGHNNTDNNNTDCLNVIFSLSGIMIKIIILKNFSIDKDNDYLIEFPIVSSMGGH